MADKKPVKMKCKDCEKINYFTNKTKGDKEKKLELKKFCNFCKKHVIHKEMKR